MYYKQLPCIYHPDLMITNFCQHQDCLMPLCPSCIRQHTDYHEDISTKPSYFNIYEALAQTDTLITNYIANLQKDKKRNVLNSQYPSQSELIFKVNRLPAVVHQKIQQAKTLALKIIQQSFSQLQRDTIQQINNLNQQMNMHSLRKSQHLEQSIVTNLQDLYDLVEGLKTQSCLSDMIFFLKEKRFQVEDLHTQMSRYLYSNENYQPCIEISKEAQHSLAVIIHRMFKLDPKDKMVNSIGQQRMTSRGQGKGLYENSYHISLTPSKIKKEMFSFQNDKTINNNPSSKYSNKQQVMAMSSRHRNTSYQYIFDLSYKRNYAEYQEHIYRSRQASKEKALKNGDQGKPISIRDKDRRIYPTHEDSAGKRNLQASSRREIRTSNTMSRYPGYGKF